MKIIIIIIIIAIRSHFGSSNFNLSFPCARFLLLFAFLCFVCLCFPRVTCDTPALG